MEIRRFTENDSIRDVSRVYALSWKAAYKQIHTARLSLLHKGKRMV